MSKKITVGAWSKRAFVVLLLFAALTIDVVVGTAAARTGAQRAKRRKPTAAATALASRREALRAATDAVLKETGEVRQLPALGPVKSGLKSRGQIKNLIMARLNEENTPREMRASELTLRKLGLVDDAFRLRRFMVNLLTEQVAGYYDPRAREFYLADWIEVEAQELVMSHELAHALQDQHFDLRRFEKWPEKNSDAELAAHALIEGDATLVMAFYMARDPRRALQIFKSMLSAGIDTKRIDEAPRALRATLLFPYEQGREWAQTIQRRGGWEAISKAYAELPLSTEQILHPEKYIAREKPEAVSLPNVAAALGPDWRRVDEDVSGEWGYYLILGQFIPDGEAKRAAAGWNGDRYALYERRRTNQLCLVHLSSWDGEAEAREFAAAYAQRTEKRGEKKGGEVTIETKSARVLIVEGATAEQKARVAELLKNAF